MNTEQRQKELLVNYLLNNLSEQDRDAVENKYFLDDEWLFNLLDTEDQLIRDYVHNRLSGDIRNRFETTYLAMDAGRGKLDHYLQVQRMEMPHSEVAQNPDLEPRTGYRSSSIWHFWENRPLLFAGVAVLLLVICGIWTYLPEKSDHRSVASGPATPSGPPVGETTVLALLHVSEDTRSGESTHADSNPNPAVITNAGTKLLEMKLKLRPPIYPKYQGRLLDKNEHFAEVAHKEELTPETSQDMRYVLWKLGTDEVPIGDYQVELQGVSATGVKGETSHYEFKLRTR
jgi:hypothetical protein